MLELKLRNLAKLEEMSIRGEQDELATERDELQKILGSAARLKTLIRNELLAVAAKYGDERRSPLVLRGGSQSLQRRLEMVSADPVTVVMSERRLDSRCEGPRYRSRPPSATSPVTASSWRCTGAATSRW